VVEDLGHYAIDDTHNLTGQHWWSLSLSSDMQEIKHQVKLP
jgi:hypothetical protein